MRHFRAPKNIPLAFHQDHRVEVRPAPKMPGQGYYHCLDCNKWVAWLTKKDSESARQMGLLKGNKNGSI
jgi:hypothetical protein